MNVKAGECIYSYRQIQQLKGRRISGVAQCFVAPQGDCRLLPASSVGLTMVAVVQVFQNLVLCCNQQVILLQQYI